MAFSAGARSPCSTVCNGINSSSSCSQYGAQLRQFVGVKPYNNQNRVGSSIFAEKGSLTAAGIALSSRQGPRSAISPQGQSSAARVVLAAAGSKTGIAETPSAEALRVWQETQAVCFDVDSTLCEDESIDELAAFLGVGEQVAALTASAMGGSVPFQEALKQRLDLMAPSSQQLDAYLESHPPLISKGIPELVAALKASGKQVFLVSGGFRAIINPIADLLGLPRDHVFANTILFKEGDGSYGGFDAEEFTSRSGGKAEAVRYIKGKYGYSTMAMVGDGATDLEARQPGGADIFVGYGGSIMRQNIAEQADWYVFTFDPLIEALPNK